MRKVNEITYDLIKVEFAEYLHFPKGKIRILSTKGVWNNNGVKQCEIKTFRIR
jgi:hypothetical protein